MASKDSYIEPSVKVFIANILVGGMNVFFCLKREGGREFTNLPSLRRARLKKESTTALYMLYACGKQLHARQKQENDINRKPREMVTSTRVLQPGFSP